MKVTILSGVPGCGKTRLADERWAIGAVVVSADNHLPKSPKPQDFGVAHANCFQNYLSFLTESKDIIVDNTNLHAWEISPYVLAAQAHFIEVVILRLVPSSYEECYRRQVHNVPFNTFCNMVAAFLKRDVLPWWSVSETAV